MASSKTDKRAGAATGAAAKAKAAASTAAPKVKASAKKPAKAPAKAPATVNAPDQVTLEPLKPAAKAPAKLPPMPALGAPDMVLELNKEARLLPGCGFGIGQPVMLGAIDVKLPKGFDLEKIEKAMEEFALAPVEYVPAGDSRLEAHLVSRIHVWQSTIQRDAKVPAFGSCRLWDRGEAPGASGARRIGFALPSYARIPTEATLRFVIEAIAALAPAAANAEQVLPVVRERYKALLQLVPRYAVTGSNALHFIEAAHLLGIERNPVFEQMWAFGVGRNRSFFNSSITSATPHFGVSIAKDKLKCSQLLAAAGLPVAKSGQVRSADTAAKLAQQIGYPVVIKPVDADQGLGVTAGIEDEADLRRAFAAAAKVSKRVMVEKHHDGRDYRVTVVHGKAVKVMDRRPGGVTGDGQHTVAELVAARNAEDTANRAYMRKQRPPLLIDEEASIQLAAQGFDTASVVPAGQFVPLRRRANISAGGTYDILAPDEIHPDNRLLGENAAIALGLDIAGIDIISGDPKVSWRETGGIICEVNAQPQIGYRDSEKLFGEILTAVLGGNGDIPVHLLVLQEDFELPKPLPELAKRANCNAAVWGANGWIAGAGMFGPFANVFRAAKGVFLDKRVTGALVAMTEPELLRFGLPVARLASIRLIGAPDWEPAPAVQQFIAGHSRQILRAKAGAAEQAVCA